jgi:hypothetical protein
MPLAFDQFSKEETVYAPNDIKTKEILDKCLQHFRSIATTQLLKCVSVPHTENVAKTIWRSRLMCELFDSWKGLSEVSELFSKIG